MVWGKGFGGVPPGHRRPQKAGVCASRPPPKPDFKQRARRREGKVPEESVERGPDSLLAILRSGKTGPIRWRWKLPTLKTRLAIACGGGLIYDVAWLGVHNGNSRLQPWALGHSASLCRSGNYGNVGARGGRQRTRVLTGAVNTEPIPTTNGRARTDARFPKGFLFVKTSMAHSSLIAAGRRNQL
jgi:hypothetical protein